MKSYIYFISFSCQDKRDYSMGFGCVELSMSNPVTSLNQLAAIVPRIQNELEIMKVTPLYFTLLRTEERKQ